jgi:Large polyvalent protein-associated domain 7
MLVRISEGSEGVVGYLIKGRKQGREYERDLIDERVILDGNIDMLNTVINVMQVKEGSTKYKHITLGFSEEDITPEKIAEVVAQFKSNLLNAYDENEVCFYAEAHMPKLSHELNRTTGEMQKRLPHVHIVMPITNMLTGKYLNPLPYKDTRFIDAIQETINNDFGLTSPKNTSARISLGLERFKGDKFKNFDLKNEVQSLIKDGVVTDLASLKSELEKIGDVRIRNEGKVDAYLNIKLPDSPKGINLKEFTAATFLDASSNHASANDKRLKKSYADLETWLNTKSHEVKLINPYRRKTYKELTVDDKKDFLENLIIQDEEKIKTILHKLVVDPDSIKLEKNNEHRRGDKRPEKRFSDHPLKSKWYSSSAFGNLFQPNAANHPSRQASESTASVFEMPSFGVDNDRILDMFLSHHAPNKLGKDNIDNPLLRRSNKGDGSNASSDGSFVKQSLKDLGNKTGQIDYNSQAAEPVLAYLARNNLLDPSKEYKVDVGKDGKPRIEIEGVQHNVTDFFTKHLKIEFSLAKSILNTVSKSVADGELPQADEKFRLAFARYFTELKNQKNASNQAANKTVLKEWAKERMAVQQIARDKRLAIQSLGNTERSRLKKNIETERLESLKLLREKFKGRVVKNYDNAPDYKDSYKSFIQKLAEQGGLEALEELRRLNRAKTALQRVQRYEDFLSGSAKQGGKAVFTSPHYTVDKDGTVVYTVDGKKGQVRDASSGVRIENGGIEAHVFALRLSAARYGSQITIEGNQAFVDKTLKAAKMAGITLEITVKINDVNGFSNKEPITYKINPQLDKATMKPKR